ncbi:MAG: DUF1028 domain-containing protein [Gemmataceae bacterium]|nr:DUF1028 domain-containing protein [Gemmataceae bacterium]
MKYTRACLAVVAAAALTALSAVLCAGPPSLARMPDDCCNTFSIVAHDPETKEWGVGVASKVLAVGSVVPYAKAGVGAVATQSFANPTFGPDGLKLLAEGKTAEETLKILVEADKGRAQRQVGVIDREGRIAHYSGDKCNGWFGAKSGKNYSCQGNLLAGPAVIDDMAKAFEEAKGPFAWRILASMQAAEKAGGDKRGKQSAAILIVREKGGYAGGNDRYVDLRVDDHDEPIQELARVLAKRIKKPKE